MTAPPLSRGIKAPAGRLEGVVVAVRDQLVSEEPTETVAGPLY